MIGLRGHCFGWLTPVVLGSVLFSVIVGPCVLRIDNIGWLAEGDPAFHYLGSRFFLNAPWSFPLGLNPTYGLDISSSIVYADSVPLLALFFKPLVTLRLLPGSFQYFGIWIYVCFVLQAVFGWKLAGVVVGEPWGRAFAATMFVIAPPMMFRLYGHLALVGQFVILTALYLNFGPDQLRRQLWWPVLLGLTVLVHPYLFVMVAALWIADVSRRLLERERQYLSLGVELVLAAVFVLFCAWQGGYLCFGQGAADEGFGYYCMNVLAPVDPGRWSYVLPDLPGRGGDYEGFNYLGLGFLVAVLFAGYACITGAKLAVPRIQRLPLLVILCLLTLYSFSNHISFGSSEVNIPVPVPGANALRASGRMFWPVFYALLFFTIGRISTRFGSRHTAVLLASLALVQFVDTHSGWRALRPNYVKASSSTWNTPLTSDFWKAAARRYKVVRVVPFGFLDKKWQFVAYYAAENGMATDCVLLARTDWKKEHAMSEELEARLLSGEFEPDTLYVLDEELMAECRQSVDSERDLLTRVDGLYVLAPGWRSGT